MPNSPAGSVYVALLRAVNVGGTGKLPMADLRAMCTEIGFQKVQTYIQSGNVVFWSALPRNEVQATLENALAVYAGKPVGVFVRGAAAIDALVRANPFPEAAPNQVLVVFADDPAEGTLTDGAKGFADEEVLSAGGEIFIHFPRGVGQSRLGLPVMDRGTARNLNTVSRLSQMAREVEGRC